MAKILLATANKGKIAELSGPLARFGIEVKGLADYPAIGDIPEDGSTFTENALIKARAAAKASGLISVADDSGLMVDALNGAPGVFSARYGDDWPLLANETRDQRNIRKLLHAMRDIPPERRGCKFVTVMAAVKPDGQEITANGDWRGLLLNECRGDNGFGYDPVFFDPEAHKTAAQLTRAEKNSRSHRGKALAALLEKLPDFIK